MIMTTILTTKYKQTKINSRYEMRTDTAIQQTNLIFDFVVLGDVSTQRPYDDHRHNGCSEKQTQLSDRLSLAIWVQPVPPPSDPEENLYKLMEWAGCPSCHLTITVKTIKGAQSNNQNQWPGPILSSSKTRLLMEEVLLPLLL